MTRQQRPQSNKVIFSEQNSGLVCVFFLKFFSVFLDPLSCHVMSRERSGTFPEVN